MLNLAPVCAFSLPATSPSVLVAARSLAATLSLQEDTVTQRMRAGVRLLGGAVLLTAIVLWCFPKERQAGGMRGGPIAPSQSAYREDYICLGVKADFCPNWPDYGCDRLCFGAVVARACSIETYDAELGLSRVPTECRGPARPRWWFPESLASASAQIRRLFR